MLESLGQAKAAMSQASLPPGQQLVSSGKWPAMGEAPPEVDRSGWRVAVAGDVQEPCTFTLADLQGLPQIEQSVDIHCVTRWSKLGARFTGVRLAKLLDLARPTSSAKFVSFVAKSARGHSTSLPLTDALALDSLVALAVDGVPLDAEHGGPVRAIVPGRYFYKSLKWLWQIDLLATDRLGFWEATAGYHNEADPWREQRYMAPGLSKQQAKAILDGRNIAGRDLRSLNAEGTDLSGLIAKGALLRDANFRDCRLAGGNFDEANLTNAHFQRADLRGATLRNADLEGANFAGADLRGACLSGARLLAATFVEAGNSPGQAPQAALFDAQTQLDREVLQVLSAAQCVFIEGILART